MMICQKKCCISNALGVSEDVIVWEDDVENKDDSDWVVNTDNQRRHSTTRGLGPNVNVWGQSIGISIGMLPPTLIISRLNQLSRHGARI
jgi:hypothetical protein